MAQEEPEKPKSQALQGILAPTAVFDSGTEITLVGQTLDDLEIDPTLLEVDEIQIELLRQAFGEMARRIQDGLREDNASPIKFLLEMVGGRLVGVLGRVLKEKRDYLNTTQGKAAAFFLRGPILSKNPQHAATRMQEVIDVINELVDNLRAQLRQSFLLNVEKLPSRIQFAVERLSVIEELQAVVENVYQQLQHFNLSQEMADTPGVMHNYFASRQGEINSTAYALGIAFIGTQDSTKVITDRISALGAKVWVPEGRNALRLKDNHPAGDCAPFIQQRGKILRHGKEICQELEALLKQLHNDFSRRIEAYTTEQMSQYRRTTT